MPSADPSSDPPRVKFKFFFQLRRPFQDFVVLGFSVFPASLWRFSSIRRAGPPGYSISHEFGGSPPLGLSRFGLPFSLSCVSATSLNVLSIFLLFVKLTFFASPVDLALTGYCELYPPPCRD